MRRVIHLFYSFSKFCIYTPPFTIEIVSGYFNLTDKYDKIKTHEGPRVSI